MENSASFTADGYSSATNTMGNTPSRQSIQPESSTNTVDNDSCEKTVLPPKKKSTVILFSVKRKSYDGEELNDYCKLSNFLVTIQAKYDILCQLYRLIHWLIYAGASEKLPYRFRAGVVVPRCKGEKPASRSWSSVSPSVFKIRGENWFKYATNCHILSIKKLKSRFYTIKYLKICVIRYDDDDPTEIKGSFLRRIAAPMSRSVLISLSVRKRFITLRKNSTFLT